MTKGGMVAWWQGGKVAWWQAGTVNVNTEGKQTSFTESQTIASECCISTRKKNELQMKWASKKKKRKKKNEKRKTKEKKKKKKKIEPNFNRN